MSVKKVNYIIFALILISLISSCLFMYSPSFMENRQLVFIPTLALMISYLIVLLYQQELHGLRGRLNTFMSDDQPHESKLPPLIEFWAGALDDIHEIVVILDQNHRVIYHNKNAAELFGIEKGEIYTDDMAEKGSPFGKSQLVGLKQALSSGVKWEDEQTLYINGEARTYLHRIIPIYEKETIRTIIYSTDISELIQIRKEVEAASTAKNQFLANISHELRTPLIGILGAVELLELKAQDTYENENFKIINNCGEHLLAIINKILDVSRLDLGVTACHPGECNIRNIIEQTLSSVYPASVEKGLSMDIHIDDNMPDRVIIDHYKLEQVLLNILNNAVKFTRQGGIKYRLDYSKCPASAWITISIADSGIGIPENQLSKIFSPFTQVDNSSSRQYQGTGLDLYLCKELVDLMNGELWVESELQRGSTFYIKVPVEEVIDLPQADFEPKSLFPDGMDELLWGFNPTRILVVDDNQLTQKIVCQTLHNYGFQADAANNGLEGFDMLQKNHYDLVLMDMQMPLMDGYETTMLIRSDKEYRSLPIIAMTADSTADARQKCLGCGCNVYISKPFKAEDLIHEINNCLQATPETADDDANELIAELIPEFLDSLCESIQELDEAVKNHDIQEVKSISHDIKGSAGLYGLHEISHTAARIEQAAGMNEHHAITNSFSELRDLYKKLGA